MDWNRSKRLSGHKKMAGIIVLVAATLLAFSYFQGGGLGVAVAGDDGGVIKLNDQAEILEIINYYVRGADTVGNERNTPDCREKALEWYRKGFTEDCTFEYLWPDGSTIIMSGLEEMVDAGIAQFNAVPYRNTFHDMGNNFVAQISGDTAELQSYGTIRHIRPDNSEDVGLGFFTFKCIRQQGVWKCWKRIIKVVAFDNWAPEF